MYVKNKQLLSRMRTAGKLLAEIFETFKTFIQPGLSTEAIDAFIAQELDKRNLVSCTKGYKGYKHVCCISINDAVVHGVPSAQCFVKEGDIVKVDICASWNKGCADMARAYYIGENCPHDIATLLSVGQKALDAGISKWVAGNRLYDISYAIQQEIEKAGYGIVQEFAGHGIGKNMHEEPDVPNYGTPGQGMLLREGMTFALEPMLMVGDSALYIDKDKWTARTQDGSLTMHVEDTVLVTSGKPEILTRL